MLSRNDAFGILGITAAAAVVRHTLAPNTEAQGPTKRRENFIHLDWAARARSNATEAGALPIPTVSFRSRSCFCPRK